MLAPAPMLSATARALPAGEGWILQPKWDGFRVLIAVRADGRAAAWSRHGTPLSGRLGGLENLVAATVPAGTVLDGELVALALGPSGPVQDFAAVGRAVFGGQHPGQLHYVAFDILQRGGEDLQHRPWTERDDALRETLAAGARVHLCDTFPATPDAHEQLVALGFEGAVLKQRRSAYRSGRHNTWRKLKARHQLDVEVLGRWRGRDRRLYATCLTVAHDQVLVVAADRHAPRLGAGIVAHSRLDADGSPREPYLQAASLAA